ncbi:MAG TPA: hypothetical protein VG753_00530 [Candidatus Paceibacterota bacterium]|nr:hypothetical protein [Candidatus Paceibacterota bacterium]
MEGAQHHAYIYEGQLARLGALAEDARERFSFANPADPDIDVLEIEKFGIEEARDLAVSAQLAGLSGRRLFILGVSSMTTEAQQALLKLFEEPKSGTMFVLLAPPGVVIATLRSRFMPYPEIRKGNASQKVLGSPSGSAQPDHFAQHFLSGSSKVRTDEIAKLLKDEEGTKERVREFLNTLEVSLRAALVKSKGDTKIREGLEDIAKVRAYANDRAPAMKMLLEHLAVSLPIVP